MKRKRNDDIDAPGHTVDLFGHVDGAARAISEPPNAPAVEPSAGKKRKREESVKDEMRASRTKSMARPENKELANAKAEKSGKQVVRETFSMPGPDSKRIEQLRLRVARSGVMLNRSEIVRAGLEALSRLEEKSLLALAADLPRMKTGRPT